MNEVHPPDPPGRRANRRWLAAILGLLAAACLFELAIRGIGEVDERGQFVFQGRILRPFVLPADELSGRLQALGAEAWRRDYHPVLGWAPREEDADINALGARATHDHTPVPRDGVYRVALFGDSFVFGDGVSADESIAAQLEALLLRDGVDAEVLNFGARGYGMDQALLRYREFGVQTRPDLVIVGLQGENIWRNLNLLRPIYYPKTGIPYAKPRFALEPDGELRLVNVPVLPPEQLPAVLADLANWELLEYENCFNWDDYARPLWRRSRALSLLADIAIGERPAVTRRFRNEAIELAVAILARFELEARENGSEFLLVHLPDLEAFRSFKQGRPLRHQALLDAVGQGQEVVSPFDELNRSSPFLGGDGFHYGPSGNLAIARALELAVLPLAQGR